MHTFRNTLFLLGLFGFVSFAFCQSIPAPKKFITNHVWTNAGKNINYKAVAQETLLKNKAGDTTAALWNVSYLKTDTRAAQRPVTFVFNGGPGSASVWLHFGFLGPKVVQVDSDANSDDGAAPFDVIDNRDFLINQTDLVFIDPIGVGYSRVLGKGKGEDFWGLNEDAASVAQFIRTWITENKRWASPKYLIGESFGTMRAAAVAKALEEDGQDVALNGLILISQALDYAGSTSVDDNIVSYVTYFPSMAATAQYHKKAGAGKSVEEFAGEARQFVYDSYLPALYKGNLLSEAERKTIAQKMAYFLGLSETYILQSNLRVLVPRFQKELLRDKGLTLGRLDARYKGEEADQIAEKPTLGDASDYQIGAAYTAVANSYFADDLQIVMDRPYLTGNDEVGEKWRWRDVPEGQYWEPTFANVTRRLSNAMRRNTQLKVMVACGYYDLITPFFDAEYTFSRNGFPKDRIELKYFPSGHMIYNHHPDFEKLANDIKTFIGEN